MPIIPPANPIKNHKTLSAMAWSTDNTLINNRGLLSSATLIFLTQAVVMFYPYGITVAPNVGVHIAISAVV